MPPKYVWLSRQLMTVLAPLLLLAALLLAAVLVGAVVMPAFFPHNQWEWQRVGEVVFGLGYTVLGVFGYVIVCLAAGQFCFDAPQRRAGGALHRALGRHPGGVGAV